MDRKKLPNCNPLYNQLHDVFVLQVAISLDIQLLCKLCECFVLFHTTMQVFSTLIFFVYNRLLVGYEGNPLTVYLLDLTREIL